MASRSPDPIPVPAPAPWVAPRSIPGDEPAAVPMTPTVGAAEPEPADDVRDPDVAVLMRAQASATPAHEEEAEDPYFAELRRAITDPQPLGPRDDDEETFEGSVEDIFDPRRTFTAAPAPLSRPAP